MKTRTIIIVAGVALGLIYIWVVFTRALDVAMYGSPSTVKITSLLSLYIMEYGCFPPSEDDLVKEGCLRRRETPDGVEYDAGFDGHWNAAPFWGRFTIRYGASIDGISQVDGKLYDKDTGEQILLIDGPYKKELEPTYESYSFELYKEMVKAEEELSERDSNNKGSVSEGDTV